LDVRVEKIVPRGYGLAFAERLTVFVSLAVPGDELTVRITDLKKRLAFAEIVEIKHLGARRVVPPCKYFGECGGCNFQQLDYTAQLAAKVEMLRDCLTRIGNIHYEASIPIIGSPHPMAYRSRARWHIDKAKRSLGYFHRNSHDVINIDVCAVLTPGLQSALEYTRESMAWDMLWSDNPQVEAASGEEGRISIYSAEIPEPTAELTFSVRGETYSFSAEAFFQANKFLVGDLIDTAVGDASGETALDLYAGVGLFAIPLARRFEEVVAVEDDAAAVGFARKNIANAGLSNVSVMARSVAGYLSDKPPAEPDLVLIDPPRSGTEDGVIQKIAALRPSRIVYVSCEPSILARDLKLLTGAGYRIEKMTAIDLFPQTHHVETVVSLRSN
jgi:23S rRNA (uracil1939-C5)-methyltransferase